MKLSKSRLMLLVLGIVVLGGIMFGMLFSQKAQQKQETEAKLIAAQQKLAQVKIDDLTSQKEQLSQDKALFTAQIAEAKVKLTAPFDNIAATDIILKSAHNFDINIVNMNCGGKSTSIMAGHKFTVLPFSIQAEGNTFYIADFISNLKALFPTSLVQTYQFGIDTPAPAASPLPEHSKDAAAKIDIIIYDYLGDANVE